MRRHVTTPDENYSPLTRLQPDDQAERYPPSAVNSNKRAAGNIQQAEIPTNIQLAACRLPDNHINAVCTSRTSAVVINTPIPAAKTRNTNTNQNKSRAGNFACTKITIKATNKPPARPATGRQNIPSIGNWKISHSTATLHPSLTPIKPDRQGRYAQWIASRPPPYLTWLRIAMP